MLLRGYILIAIGLIEILLALWFLFRYKRAGTNNWYVAFVSSIAFWVLANAGIYFYANNLVRAQFYNELTWLGGVLIALTFLFFSFYFPITLKPVKKYSYLLIIIPLIVFVYLIFFSKLLLTGMVFQGSNQKFFTGSLFFLLPVFILVYWIWAIINLIRKIKRTDGIHVQQLKLLLAGVLISSVFIVIFDLIYPLMGKAVYSGLGPELSLIWVGFTSYIILKK